MNELIGQDGERKIRIVGPEPNDETRRFSWKEPPDGFWRKHESLYVRLEKGISVGNTACPVFVLYFVDDALYIGQNMADGLLNPYINVVQKSAPTFVIPKKLLKEGTYAVSTIYSRHGDFLALEQENSPGNLPAHRLIINTAAIALFSGLNWIVMDGRFVWGQKIIGKLVPAEIDDSIEMLPFYRSLMCEGDIFARERYLKSFMRASSFAVQKLLALPDFDDKPTVQEFDFIDYTVWHDRATVTEQEGAKDMKKLFAQVFPQEAAPMAIEEWPPIPVGAAVQTTAPDMEKRPKWTDESWAKKKWGVKGIVTNYHDVRELCYDVVHEDKSSACYEPTEIKVIEKEEPTKE